MRRTPLDRVRAGAFFLAGVSVVAVIGHRYLHAETWLESLYWFVITVSGVGYTENSQVSDAMQAFTIVVILIGMSAAIYTVGGLIQMVFEGEVDRALGVRRMTRGIERLRGHVILCGFGRMGHLLAKDLTQQGQQVLVVDSNTDNIADAQHLDYLVLAGDATEEDVLLAAGIERAKTLISTLSSDADNLYLTLTARNLCADLQIVARGQHLSSEKKLIQAGANRVVMPTVIGARRIASMVTRPHTADLIERITSNEIMDVSIEELVISATNPLLDTTVVDAEAHRRHGLLIVAVRHSDGEMLFNPGANYTFRQDDTLMLMGRPDDIQQFRLRFQS